MEFLFLSYFGGIAIPHVGEWPFLVLENGYSHIASPEKITKQKNSHSMEIAISFQPSIPPTKHILISRIQRWQRLALLLPRNESYHSF